MSRQFNQNCYSNAHAANILGGKFSVGLVAGCTWPPHDGSLNSSRGVYSSTLMYTDTLFSKNKWQLIIWMLWLRGYQQPARVPCAAASGGLLVANHRAWIAGRPFESSAASQRQRIVHLQLLLHSLVLSPQHPLLPLCPPSSPALCPPSPSAVALCCVRCSCHGPD
jgi:hypothetical protein